MILKLYWLPVTCPTPRPSDPAGPGSLGLGVSDSSCGADAAGPGTALRIAAPAHFAFLPEYCQWAVGKMQTFSGFRRAALNSEAYNRVGVIRCMPASCRPACTFLRASARPSGSSDTVGAEGDALPFPHRYFNAALTTNILKVWARIKQLKCAV